MNWTKETTTSMTHAPSLTHAYLVTGRHKIWLPIPIVDLVIEEHNEDMKDAFLRGTGDPFEGYDRRKAHRGPRAR